MVQIRLKYVISMSLLIACLLNCHSDNGETKGFNNPLIFGKWIPYEKIVHSLHFPYDIDEGCKQSYLEFFIQKTYYKHDVFRCEPYYEFGHFTIWADKLILKQRHYQEVVIIIDLMKQKLSLEFTDDQTHEKTIINYRKEVKIIYP